MWRHYRKYRWYTFESYGRKNRIIGYDTNLTRHLQVHHQEIVSLREDIMQARESYLALSAFALFMQHKCNTMF